MTNTIAGCVYLLRCKSNNKSYVGITNDLQHRWTKHLSDAKNHSNYAIHRALRKYGKENFTIEILQACNSREELLQSEIHWISKLKTHVRESGYNETFGGDAPMLGRNHSHKSKEQTSRKLKGRPSPLKGKQLSPEHKQLLGIRHQKPVHQMDLSGNIIATFESINAASIHAKIANSNISGVCRGRKITAGGFRWKYCGKGRK